MENKRFWLIDADMTLFDFERCEKAAFARACERCGVPEAAEHDKLYHEINEALWRKLERGLVTQERLRVQRFEEFAAQTGLKADAQAMADSFVESLMWDSAWSSSPADYTRLNDSRFDGVWSGRNEMIVQSGDTVWVFTYYEMETAFSREDLLQAVAERQSK